MFVPVDAASAVVDESPTCTILSHGSSQPIGVTVMLSAIAFDPEGFALTYNWFFGGAADRALTGQVESGQLLSIPVTFDAGNQVFPLALTVTDQTGQSSVCRGSVTVGVPPLSGRASVSEQPPPGDPREQAHTLLAFNDLGMHCADLGSVPFSILPPFNTVNAQVIERRAQPRLLDDTEAILRYSAASNPDDPVLPPASLDLQDQTIDQSTEFQARLSISAGNNFTVASAGK